MKSLGGNGDIIGVGASEMGEGPSGCVIAKNIDTWPWRFSLKIC